MLNCYFVHVLNKFNEYEFREEFCEKNQYLKLPICFFVDDVMLFAETSLANIRDVLGIIELFCQSSRQRINMSKSLIFSSPGIPR